MGTLRFCWASSTHRVWVLLLVQYLLFYELKAEWSETQCLQNYFSGTFFREGNFKVILVRRAFMRSWLSKGEGVSSQWLKGFSRRLLEQKVWVQSPPSNTIHSWWPFPERSFPHNTLSKNGMKSPWSKEVDPRQPLGLSTRVLSFLKQAELISFLGLESIYWEGEKTGVHWVRLSEGPFKMKRSKSSLGEACRSEGSFCPMTGVGCPLQGSAKEWVDRGEVVLTRL